MRLIEQNARQFPGTHKGATIEITRERPKALCPLRFYIIVTAPDGGHLYDGWAPDTVTTMGAPKREAIKGACL